MSNRSRSGLPRSSPACFGPACRSVYRPRPTARRNARGTESLWRPCSPVTARAHVPIDQKNSGVRTSKHHLEAGGTLGVDVGLATHRQFQLAQPDVRCRRLARTDFRKSAGSTSLHRKRATARPARNPGCVPGDHPDSSRHSFGTYRRNGNPREPQLEEAWETSHVRDCPSVGIVAERHYALNGYASSVTQIGTTWTSRQSPAPSWNERQAIQNSSSFRNNLHGGLTCWRINNNRVITKRSRVRDCGKLLTRESAAAERRHSPLDSSITSSLHR